MSDINICVFNGRLTSDAELKWTKSGTAYSKFSIAVNRKYKDKETVSFFPMTLWGKTAESLTRYLEKGKQVSIMAEAVQDRWEDANGNKRSKVDFTVKTIQLLSGGSEKKENSRPVENHQDVDFRPENFEDDDFDSSIPF